jgi:hypothetical protein
MDVDVDKTQIVISDGKNFHSNRESNVSILETGEVPEMNDDMKHFLMVHKKQILMFLSDPEVKKPLELNDEMIAFLKQNKNEVYSALGTRDGWSIWAAHVSFGRKINVMRNYWSTKEARDKFTQYMLDSGNAKDVPETVGFFLMEMLQKTKRMIETYFTQEDPSAYFRTLSDFKDLVAKTSGDEIITMKSSGTARIIDINPQAMMAFFVKYIMDNKCDATRKPDIELDKIVDTYFVKAWLV